MTDMCEGISAKNYLRHTYNEVAALSQIFLNI